MNTQLFQYIDVMIRTIQQNYVQEKDIIPLKQVRLNYFKDPTSVIKVAFWKDTNTHDSNVAKILISRFYEYVRFNLKIKILSRIYFWLKLSLDHTYIRIITKTTKANLLSRIVINVGLKHHGFDFIFLASIQRG